MYNARYVIGEEYNSMQIKDFLKNVKGYSTRQIIRIKKDVDSIRLNGKHVFVVEKLKTGDELVIKLTDTPKETDTCEINVPIIYEDENVMVFNKPPAMACQVSKLHPHSTLQNVFATVCEKRGVPLTYRCLTRLDRDTSGLTLIAKDQLTAHALSNKSTKTYYAIVSGEVKENGTVDAPIGIENEWEVVRKIIPTGQRAVTHYEILCKNNAYSFIKLKLETGRTHQIRVHMAHIGHPLLGDELYGGNHDIIGRQALHCGEMTFVSPYDNKEHKIFAEISEDMQKALKDVGLNVQNAKK